MRTLDRYIIRSFLYTALLFFVIIISLRVVVDLDVNLTDFLKGGASGGEKFVNVVSYYFYQIPLYVIELGGIIIVASAAFTLARMNHSNELTAIMASGVSLRRVIAPIFLFAVLLDVAIICDQEYLIPSIADKMLRSRDELPSEKEIRVRLMTDEAGSVWYSPKLDPNTRTMAHPLVLARSPDGTAVGVISGTTAKEEEESFGWSFTDGKIKGVGVNWKETPDCRRVFTIAGPDAIIAAIEKKERIDKNPTPEQMKDFEARLLANGAKNVDVGDYNYGLSITAKKFEPDPAARAASTNPDSQGSDEPRGGRLIEPQFTFRAAHGEMLGTIRGSQALWAEGAEGGYWQIDQGSLFFPSDLKTRDIDLRQSSRYLDYMSSRSLTQLINLKKVPDRKAALLTRHIRFTDPINNIVMLLLGLPFILSRERNIKASASLCLMIVAMFYVFIYICRYMNVDPTIAAWLPILLFGPISFVMLDSVKT
jgi:lipopolysaccharide export LptBFGC system permease protein LptF